MELGFELNDESLPKTLALFRNSAVWKLGKGVNQIDTAKVMAKSMPLTGP
jgi:hypothetical protein